MTYLIYAQIIILFPYSPVIRDTLSKTNLLVMVDDPIISTNLAELILQVQSGLTMGSRNAGELVHLVGVFYSLQIVA